MEQGRADLVNATTAMVESMLASIKARLINVRMTQARFDASVSTAEETMKHVDVIMAAVKSVEHISEAYQDKAGVPDLRMKAAALMLDGKVANGDYSYLDIMKKVIRVLNPHHLFLQLTADDLKKGMLFYCYYGNMRLVLYDILLTVSLSRFSAPRIAEDHTTTCPVPPRGDLYRLFSTSVDTRLSPSLPPGNQRENRQSSCSRNKT